MRQLHKLFRLSGGDRKILAIAYILLGAMRLGLWLLPFRKLLKLQQKISKPDFLLLTPTTSQVDIVKIVWAIDLATRYMPGGAKCLARALATQVLINRQGHTSELRIGVAKTEGGKLEAHAWVEYQGGVAIGNLKDLCRFIQLPSLEGVQL